MHELGAGWLFLGPERRKNQSSLGAFGVQIDTNYLAVYHLCFYHLWRSRQLRLQSIGPFDRSTYQIAARCLSVQRWFIGVDFRHAVPARVRWPSYV